MTELWNLVIFNPMLNGLLFLYNLLGHNFAISIVVFTILVRVLMLPLTLSQQRSAQASQELQPKLQELQKKYKNDREKLNEETMKLYREHGVNPLGCVLPMLIQLPIWIGLYQSIIHALSENPTQLVNLGKHIYSTFPILSSLVPLNSRFLWLDLARPDPFLILPILVMVTMWIQQKMATPPTPDPQQAAMNQSMQFMMPLMFGFITYQLASGLGLYFVISNIVSIVQQYFVSGWGGLLPTPVAESAPGRKEKRGRKK
ncbi:MAG: membrane protein insertase YidC [Chloroflexi bacterium]|nr:membrane protein insertase YidC [Chloroflexota bacterium]